MSSLSDVRSYINTKEGQATQTKAKHVIKNENARAHTPARTFSRVRFEAPAVSKRVPTLGGKRVCVFSPLQADLDGFGEAV